MTVPTLTDTEALRRRAPAIWNTDWLLLRGLAAQLDRMLGRIGSGSVLDFGCGTVRSTRF